MITEIYERLRDNINSLSFSVPVVYNPLSYAWHGVSQYISRYCSSPKRVIFIGMNPGPWGMAQTGVPFGEVEAVRNFLGITSIDVHAPENMHPSYPVNGLECSRSEVSGRRLWGLFREKFGTAQNFSREHTVLNYCPLLFLTDGTKPGTLRNLTPDKLKKHEREELFALCDDALREAVNILEPEYIVGIGNFAADRAKNIPDVKVVKILHPSPASPASNIDWAGKVTEQLIISGVWDKKIFCA